MIILVVNWTRAEGERVWRIDSSECRSRLLSRHAARIRCGPGTDAEQVPLKYLLCVGDKSRSNLEARL